MSVFEKQIDEWARRALKVLGSDSRAAKDATQIGTAIWPQISRQEATKRGKKMLERLYRYGCVARITVLGRAYYWRRYDGT